MKNLILLASFVFGVAFTSTASADYFSPWPSKDDYRDGHSVFEQDYPNQYRQTLDVTLKADQSCLREIRINPPNRRNLIDAVDNCNRMKWSDAYYWENKGYRCSNLIRVLRRPSKKTVNRLVDQAGGSSRLKKGDLSTIKNADTDVLVECIR